MLLYSLEGTRYVPIHQTPPVLEAQLHSSFDANLPTLLGVTPLKREFKAGSGRMDTLGFDQHGFPVIIEYKRSPHTSPLMQILSYQSWISAHPEVIEALYTSVPHPLDWRGLRLICVTPSFSQHDILAIEQIQANIDLVEFTLYEGGLMGLQTRASRRLEDYPHIHAKRTRKTPMTFDQRLENASDETAILYHKLIDGLQAKGLMLNAVDDRGTMTWHYFGDQVMRVSLANTA